nr:hypothetical protein [Parasulfuritortus cantonensis]
MVGHFQAQALGRGRRALAQGDLAQQAGGVEHHVHLVRRPDFQAGEIEYLGEQAEQIRSGPMQGLDMGLLVGVEPAATQQGGHPEDCVEGRAHLMAHGRQESRLGLAGGFGIVARLAQGPVARLQFGARRFQVADVLGELQPAPAQQFEQQPGE